MYAQRGISYFGKLNNNNDEESNSSSENISKDRKEIQNYQFSSNSINSANNLSANNERI